MTLLMFLLSRFGVPSFKQSLIYSNLTENNKNKNRASVQIYDLIMFIDMKDKWQLIIVYIEQDCELIFHLFLLIK